MEWWLLSETSPNIGSGGVHPVVSAVLPAAAASLLAVLPLAYWPSLFAPSATPRFALICTICPVLFAALIAGRGLAGRPFVFHSPSTFIGVVLLLGINVVSIAWTPDRLGAALWNVTLFSLACWFGFLVASVPARLRGDRLVAAAACGAALAALIGILQHFNVETPILQQTLPPGSTFVYANVGAQFMAPLAMVMLVMAIRARRARSMTGWTAAFLTLAGYVALTRCRGAWLGMAASLLLTVGVLLLTRVMRRELGKRLGLGKLMIAGVCIAAAAAAVLFVPLGGSGERRATWAGMLESFAEPLRVLAANSEEVMQSSSSMRLHMLRCTVRALEDNWLLGLGADGFRAGIVPFLDQHTASLCYTPQTQMLTLHCDPLQILVETGVIGGAALMMIVVGVAAAGYRAMTRGSRPDDRWLALACLAGLAALAVHSLVSFPFHMPTSSFLGVTLAAIVVGLARGETPSSKQLVLQGRPVLFSLAALVAVAAIASIVINIGYVSSMHHACVAWAAKRAKVADRALHDIDAAMAASDLHYSVRREYGVIHTRFNRDREAALRAGLGSLAHDPYYINNLVNVAAVEIDLGRFAKAEKHLRQALTINDELHLAHYALGLIAVAEGRPGDARGAFERTLALSPKFKPARQQLNRLTSDD